mgnify:CR=1 FL=1|tara:strand:+ start:82625 stop:82852 length:228 start_codon:yes stop_codon:yes gene_type:complete
MSIEQALEAVYESLHADNDGIDECIANLKTAMQAEKVKDVEIEAARLPVPNREGRNMMKSYFKKRGVVLKFKLAE